MTTQDFKSLLTLQPFNPDARQRAEHLFSLGFRVCRLVGKLPADYSERDGTLPSPVAFFTRDLQVGLCTGEGFWVLDVDGSRGMEALRWLERLMGHVIEPHMMVKTGRGWHYYFLQRDHEDVPTCIEVLPGIDVRGKGSHVVAPGEFHVSEAVRYAPSYVATEHTYAPPALSELVAIARHYNPLKGASRSDKCLEASSPLDIL